MMHVLCLSPDQNQFLFRITLEVRMFGETVESFSIEQQFIAIQSIKATRHLFRWNVITLVALLNDYKIRYFYGQTQNAHKNPRITLVLMVLMSMPRSRAQ